MIKSTSQNNNKIEEISKKPETQAVIDSLKGLKTEVNKQTDNVLKDDDVKVNFNPEEKESLNKDLKQSIDTDPRLLPKSEATKDKER